MNNQKFMPELADHRDRIAHMQQEASKVEETDYRVALTADELDQKREQFTNNSIWLKEEADKFNEIKVEYKDRIKPRATENEGLIEEIVTKQQKKTGTLYHIADFDNSLMTVYDENGDFVSSRRLTPEEKKGQSRMFIPAGKTGTNG
jgi:hypothetical protein